MAKPEKTVTRAAVETALATADAQTVAAVAGNVGAIVAPTAVVAPAAPRQFVVKRIVTMPLIKFDVGVTRYVRFNSAIFLGKAIADADPSKSKAPPHMANVTDLATGEQGQIMLGAVLVRLLVEDYPDATYNGLSFAIRLNEQKRGRGAQNYNTYSLAEIEG